MEYKTLDLRKIGSLLMGLSIMLASHSALAAVTKTELAGNSISDYPHFEYVKAGKNVWSMISTDQLSSFSQMDL